MVEILYCLATELCRRRFFGRFANSNFIADNPRKPSGFFPFGIAYGFFRLVDSVKLLHRRQIRVKNDSTVFPC